MTIVETLNRRLALGPVELAEALGIDRRGIYSRIRTGEIRAVRLGARLLVPRAEVFRLLGEPPPREAP